MKICQECESEVKEDEKICPRCGSENIKKRNSAEYWVQNYKKEHVTKSAIFYRIWKSQKNNAEQLIIRHINHI